MGLSLMGSTIKGGLYKAPDPSKAKENYHFRHMLRRFAEHVGRGEKLTKHEEESLKKLGQDCADFLHMKAHGCCSYTHVLSTLTDLIMKTGMPQVSKQNNRLFEFILFFPLSASSFQLRTISGDSVGRPVHFSLAVRDM